MRCPAALAAAALLAAPAAAAAEGDAGDWSGGYGESGTVRSDFAGGASLGLVTGRSVGYPNHAGRIGNPAYRANTGFGLGSQYAFWVGGAIKDWFVLGVGISNGNVSANHLTGYSTGFFTRVEVYPLFYRGGIFQDLAVQANFGIAGAAIHHGSVKVADGGALSLVGLGLAYETWHLYHFALGPTLEYRHLFSESLHEDIGVLSLRFVYYSRPSKP